MDIHTLSLIRRHFYWPKLVTDVKQYIAQCKVFNTSKPTNQIPSPKNGKYGDMQTISMVICRHTVSGSQEHDGLYRSFNSVSPFFQNTIGYAH